jgi:hypothetical protein
VWNRAGILLGIILPKVMWQRWFTMALHVPLNISPLMLSKNKKERFGWVFVLQESPVGRRRYECSNIAGCRHRL